MSKYIYFVFAVHLAEFFCVTEAIAMNIGTSVDMSSDMFATMLTDMNMASIEQIITSRVSSPSPTTSLDVTMSSSTTGVLLPTPTNDPSCTRSVDNVAIQFAEPIINATRILLHWRNHVINFTNDYCLPTRNARSLCGLSENFTGVYNVDNCIACIQTNFRQKRQTGSSALVYYITQPDNSNGVLPLHALLTVATLTRQAFESATGLNITNIVPVKFFVTSSTITPSPTSTEDVLVIPTIYIIIAGSIAGVLFILLLILIAFTVIVVIHVCVKKCCKKEKNRINPKSSERQESQTPHQQEQMDQMDQIYLTR
jgi:hypothetical protein